MTRGLAHGLTIKFKSNKARPILILIVLLSLLSSFVSSTAVAQANITFDDVPQDHWAAGSVERLRSVGMLQGFPDGAYYGNLALSRYQMAVLLDRMLTLARQEAQSEGLSIGEISALQQQIDQLNAILSQSVESLIAPDAGFSNNRTTLNVPITNQEVDSGAGTMSRSGLVTPASPQQQQSNYFEVQQNQAESFSTFDSVSNAVTSQPQTSVNAQQIIATYEATPSAIEYQQYLDAYMAVYGSSESGADNVQQVNRVGVLPGNAGSVSSLATNALATNTLSNGLNTQVQQTQSQPLPQQFAQQFAEEYQLQAQQPTQQLPQLSFDEQSQLSLTQQPLGFAGDFSTTQPSTTQQGLTQNGGQFNFETSVDDTQVIKSNGVYLQLGAFANSQSAEGLTTELADLGFSAMQQDQAGLYKVLVGPFDFVSVQNASELLTAQGYSFFMVR